MKYLLAFLCFGIFACSSKTVTPTWVIDRDMPKPPPIQNPLSQRKLASEEENLGVSYDMYFGKENYVNRAIKIRRIVSVLHTLMEEKGHPRKRILKKFQNDLDKQIALLEKLEGSNTDSLAQTWLPKKDTYQYGAKLRAMQNIVTSADAMTQLETYLSATKVMEDDTYEQNFYYNLMRKGLRVLSSELATVGGIPSQSYNDARFSYGGYLAADARINLHKVFNLKEQRPTLKRIEQTFRKAQQIRNLNDGKALIETPEFSFARTTLANADYSNSSDIEGSRDDMDTKISTYFGLEMIKYLYGQAN